MDFSYDKGFVRQGCIRGGGGVGAGADLYHNLGVGGNVTRVPIIDQIGKFI